MCVLALFGLRHARFVIVADVKGSPGHAACVQAHAHVLFPPACSATVAALHAFSRNSMQCRAWRIHVLALLAVLLSLRGWAPWVT